MNNSLWTVIIFLLALIIFATFLYFLIEKRHIDDNTTNIANSEISDISDNLYFNGIYKKKHYFFSTSELEMYRLLKSFFLKEYNWRYAVFPKVGLVDFIEVDKYTPNYKSFFSKMAQKHVDFLVVDQNMYCTPVLAIELNWATHGSEKMQKRDKFVGDLYKSINLNFVTFQNHDLNSSENIINDIRSIFASDNLI